MNDVKKVHLEVAKSLIEGKSPDEIQKIMIVTEVIGKKTKRLMRDFDELFEKKWIEYCDLMEKSSKVHEMFSMPMRAKDNLSQEASKLFMIRFNKSQGFLSFLHKGEIEALRKEEAKISELKNQCYEEVRKKIDAYIPTVLKKVLNNSEVQALLSQFPLEIEVQYPEQGFKNHPSSGTWSEFFDNFKTANKPRVKVTSESAKWIVEFTDEVVSAINAQIPLVKRKKAIAKLKAQASENFDIQRNLISSYRTQREFTYQLERSDACPYCERKFQSHILDSKIHLDHIYPVSKGGLSIRENLVFICSDCNVKKSDITLAIFCSRNGLDREKVTSKLLKLGKDV